MPVPVLLEDISNNNALTEEYFKTARARGVVGVYHKRSQGDYFLDRLADQRHAWARKHGLLWGEYHFHDPKVSAARQARFFLEHSPKTGWDLLPALDAEMASTGLTAVAIGQSALAVAEEWRADPRLHRLWPLLYTYPAYTPNLRPLVGRCPLWISDPDRKGDRRGPRCQPWATWVVWQDGTTGVDTDLLHGQLSAIRFTTTGPLRQRLHARPSPRSLCSRLAKGAQAC